MLPTVQPSSQRNFVRRNPVQATVEAREKSDASSSMQQNASGERKEEVRIEMRTRALVQRAWLAAEKKCNDQPSPADSVVRSLARCATRLIKLRGLDGTPTEEAGTALSTALQPRMAWSVTRNLLSNRLR
ncbi:hypothetical protein L1887_63485 [Cichorium endivia]|nr:hypothetical protein L1887_63485 [Cichorium endivia]